MSVNVPLIALSVVGVLLVAAGLFLEGSLFLVLGGVGTILFAWILQEMTKRRT